MPKNQEKYPNFSRSRDKKVIELNPPIEILAGDMPGLLTAISATHAKVRWEDSFAAGETVAIKASARGKYSHNLDCAVEDESTLRFKDHSVAVAMDLLHTVRKGQHIQICQDTDVEHSAKSHGFDAVTLPVRSLPELSWGDVDSSATFLGQVFAAPFLITGMTGGVEKGTLINERLAAAAARARIPLGVGSQRMAIENKQYESIFKLKDKFPDLFLIGNLGIAQLIRGDAVRDSRAAVDMINADALAIHVNVLQELIQVEGDRDFRGVIAKIGEVVASLPVPVIVKEVGCGLDTRTAKALWDAGVRHFDVGGAGGTSWAFIEGQRANDSMVRRRGQVFRDFGIPTAVAVRSVRDALPDATIIATGGIRDGLVARKAIYTGANMVGVGLPLMRAALTGERPVCDLLDSMMTEYKIAVMCTH